jgi:hypothetical protein
MLESLNSSPINESKFKGVGLNMQFELEEYRQKIGAMSQPELRKVRSTLASQCLPQKSVHLQPDPQWVLQLEECRAEWLRRHPRPTPKPPRYSHPVGIGPHGLVQLDLQVISRYPPSFVLTDSDTYLQFSNLGGIR